MFKYSLCFATLAMLVFLFRADEDGGDTREPNFDFDDDSVDYDYDDYDEDIGDYSDIDIDNLDYDTLLEIEKTLESLSRDGLGEGGNGEAEKVADSKKSSGKGLKEEISRMRANIDGLDSNVPDNKMLSDEDREKGYKVTNMKLLKNFEAPGGLEPDEILKEAEKTNDDKLLRNGKEEL